jgi:hypothetical protein
MKFKKALLTVIAMAMPVAAHAAAFTNGDFQTGYSSNTEFGSSFSSGVGPTGWSASGYALYYDGSNSTSASALGQYAGSGKEKLWATLVGGASNGLTSDPIFGASGNHFVALDGDTATGVQASIWQTLTGLVSGDTYEIAFNWGAAQLQSATGATTDSLQVTFGSASQTTSVLSDVSQGFVSGGLVKMSFVASSTSQLLQFLSIGTPNGLPPIALLDNVTVTDKTVHAAVPEPATLAVMLTGIGLTGLMARRRRNNGSSRSV